VDRHHRIPRLPWTRLIPTETARYLPTSSRTLLNHCASSTITRTVSWTDPNWKGHAKGVPAVHHHRPGVQADHHLRLVRRDRPDVGQAVAGHLRDAGKVARVGNVEGQADRAVTPNPRGLRVGR